MDYQITNNLIPYFKKLHSSLMRICGGKYRVGIYGPRNACTRVCNAGYACSSFVSDMSTGFSGNLGFPIPENWALDQFATTTISSNGKSIEIDKDGFSGRYEGISQEYSIVEEDSINNTNTLRANVGKIRVNMGGSAIPVYEKKVHKEQTGPYPSTPLYVTGGKKIGEIKINDFYVRYSIQVQVVIMFIK